MAIRIVPNPEFRGAARITVPGATEPAEIEITWRHKGRRAIESWLARFEGRPDAEILDEIMADWAGVDGPEGAVRYSREALAQLLDAYPAAAAELCRAYLNASAESRAKN